MAVKMQKPRMVQTRYGVFPALRDANGNIVPDVHMPRAGLWVRIKDYFAA